MFSTASSQPSTNAKRPLLIRSLLKSCFSINPILTVLGFGFVLLLVVSLVGMAVDHRVVTGLPIWDKPAKFSISLSIYVFTLLWFLHFIKGRKWLVFSISLLSVLGWSTEMVCILIQVARGTSSHFNVSTDFDNALYSWMGRVVMLLFVLNLVIAIFLLFQKLPNPTLAWSLRLGMFIMMVGMAVALLMTTRPTPEQLALIHANLPLTTFGAHTVGLPDGGPGLPFLGWSTVGGDLRIPHFVGLHGFQALPLLGWLLSRARIPFLRTSHRVALIWTLSASYLGLIALLTWQALRAQSIIAPDILTLQAFAILLSFTVLVVALIIVHARTSFKQI